MGEKFFKLKKITAYENNLPYIIKSTRLILQSVNHISYFTYMYMYMYLILITDHFYVFGYGYGASVKPPRGISGSQ